MHRDENVFVSVIQHVLYVEFILAVMQLERPRGPYW